MGKPKKLCSKGFWQSRFWKKKIDYLEIVPKRSAIITYVERQETLGFFRLTNSEGDLNS